MELLRSEQVQRRRPAEEAWPGGEGAPRLEQIAAAVDRARAYLLGVQHPNGHWCGELEGDTILETEYVLLLQYLGRGGEPRCGRAAEQVRRKQLNEGGWAIYPGGPPDVSASVKAYFVLKLQGDSPEAPHLVRARRAILELGGIRAVNSFTQVFLALLGQYEWEQCPAIPPEIVLLPRWLYFNLSEMSSWSRTIVVPLTILWARRPVRPVPAHAGIQELIAPGRPTSPATPGLASRPERWRAFFRVLDRQLKRVEKSGGFALTRERALQAAEEWMVERLEQSDGLGAIFPSIVYSVFALVTLGYPESHPLVRRQLRELEKLEITDGAALRLQPCLSPVWDTSLALNALAASGMAADDSCLLQAARWLVSKEVRTPGDWRVHNPQGQVGGWYFEYANELYPDCDDTCQVLTALSRLRIPEQDRVGVRAATQRGLRWLLSMQNPDGGWAAFDRECAKEVLSFVPFADHNAMLDPSCPDITGRVLEALCRHGFGRNHPSIRRGVEYLRASQESDGTWYGRWGCNYLYGTWLALVGLAAAGEDLAQPRYQRAAQWLAARQNADGGWGESYRSYDEPRTKGLGPSTAAQTSWALMGLWAAGDRGSASLSAGIHYLLRTQGEDGRWRDEEWTGTGFPRVFYLRYDLYDDYFPLLALSTLLPERVAAAP